MRRRQKAASRERQVPKAVKRRLLREGVKLLGREEVAAHLQVPVRQLDAWLRGGSTLPEAKMVLLADLMLEKLSERRA